MNSAQLKFILHSLVAGSMVLIIFGAIFKMTLYFEIQKHSGVGIEDGVFNEMYYGIGAVIAGAYSIVSNFAIFGLPLSLAAVLIYFKLVKQGIGSGILVFVLGNALALAVLYMYARSNLEFTALQVLPVLPLSYAFIGLLLAVFDKRATR